MVDDFWGDDEWQNFYHEIKRVFPEREPIDVPLEHPIFHCAFDLDALPQVPSIANFLQGQHVDWPGIGEPNYRAIFDDGGRMLVFICHNTDLADGWERVADDDEFAKQLSLPKAIPMGINVVFYALTQGDPPLQRE